MKNDLAERLEFAADFHKKTGRHENAALFAEAAAAIRDATNETPTDREAVERCDIWVANIIREVANDALARYDIPEDIYEGDVLIDASSVCAADKVIRALLARAEAAEAERDELAEAIDSAEISNGLTSNGSMWRFWEAKGKALQKIALEYGRKMGALLARAEAAEAERDAAFKALEWYADEVMAYSITQKEEPRSAVHADKGKRARAALRALADKGDG